MWNYEGLTVTGKYLGEIPISGRVESSRVAYGGRVKHTIVLDKPIKFRWRNEPSDRVILDHEFVETVKS